MTDLAQSRAEPARLRAWPYWLTLTFVPLVVLAVAQGGWTILLIPVYGWVLMPLLDLVIGQDLRNPDPDTPDSELFWFRLLTWIWFPVQVCLIYGTLYVLTHTPGYSTAETLGIMFGIGVTTGTVGIVYSHELMHKSNRIERELGDLLLALVLYGHFRTEHLLVHHPWVGTPRDTVTARYNEGFLRAFPRVLWQGPGSAWRAEKAKLARRGLSPWHLTNPIWKYLGLGLLALAAAFAIRGLLAVGSFGFHAFAPLSPPLLAHHLQASAPQPQAPARGHAEPVKPHHSWDSAHRVSGNLLINLQRHADHHLHPMRRYPLLQVYDETEVPMLPTGYPPMTAMAMVPPVWRRVFNPRVRAWRRQFYPEIADWTRYKDGTNPMPKGAG